MYVEAPVRIICVCAEWKYTDRVYRQNDFLGSMRMPNTNIHDLQINAYGMAYVAPEAERAGVWLRNH
jgi:hypothetical protein